MKWFVKPLATIALVLMILGTGGTPISAKVVHVSKTVTYGNGHILVVKEDGSLYGIGPNQYGQLGDGTTTGRTEFVQILSSGVATAETGSGFSLLLKKDGSLWGMGSNEGGQLGLTNSGPSDYNRTTPVQIVAEGVTQIACGVHQTLFVKSDGSLWASGRLKELGGVLVNEGFVEGMNPVQIVSSGAVSVSVGTTGSAPWNTFFFIKSDGSLWEINPNSFNRSDVDWNSVQLEQIVSSGVQSVTTGGRHHLFLKTDGSLWGWGENSYGQLGYNPTPSSPDFNKTSFESPIQSEAPFYIHNWTGADEISAISAGLEHTLLLDNNGTIFGMGRCSSQLGRVDVFQDTGMWITSSSGIFPGVSDLSAYYPNPIVSARRSNEFKIFPDETYVSHFDEQFSVVENVSKIRGSPYGTFFIKNDGSLWFVGNLDTFWGDESNYVHRYNAMGVISRYYYDPVQVILPETTSDSGSSESNSSTTVDPSKLNEAWGYFKYPWVYNSSIPSWLYLHATDQGQLLWCEKDKSWYSWDSTTQAWKKN